MPTMVDPAEAHPTPAAVSSPTQWWRVMQGQREEDRENADENTADADADTDAGREQDTAARPRTPEVHPRTSFPCCMQSHILSIVPQPTSPLYTVSEDADQPSSAESTPPRESPLPLAFLPGAGPEFGLGLLGLGRPSADVNALPRAHAAPRAFSFPGLALTAFRIADGDPITHDPDMRRR